MSDQRPEELDFLEKLSEEDRQKFYNMSQEEKRTVITENLLSHQDDRLWDNDAGISQLIDRIATKSFQG